MPKNSESKPPKPPKFWEVTMFGDNVLQGRVGPWYRFWARVLLGTKFTQKPPPIPPEAEAQMIDHGEYKSMVCPHHLDIMACPECDVFKNNQMVDMTPF